MFFFYGFQRFQVRWWILFSEYNEHNAAKKFLNVEIEAEVLIRDLSWSPAGFSPKFSSPDGQGEEEAEMILAKVPPNRMCRTGLNPMGMW